MHVANVILTGRVNMEVSEVLVNDGGVLIRCSVFPTRSWKRDGNLIYGHRVRCLSPSPRS